MPRPDDRPQQHSRPAEPAQPDHAPVSPDIAGLFRSRYAPLILQLRRIGPRLPLEDLEDAAQQAFLELWDKPCGDMGEEALVSYLGRIATSRLLDRLRQEAARRRRERGCAGHEPIAQNDHAAALTAEEERQRVRRAIARLEPDLRQAIELIDLQGLTAREAATRAHCTTDAIRGRQRRGRKQLLELLDRQT